MTIHPKIKHIIGEIKNSGYDTIHESNIEALWKTGATATEAAITLHLGFNYELKDAEDLIRKSDLWEPEAIQDIAYQTFIYMNYNPDDPNFFYDEKNVRFSLIQRSQNKNQE